MPKLDMAAAPRRTGSVCPEPFAAMVAGRGSMRPGQGGGLTRFGVNIVVPDPGARSSLPHGHRGEEDEFVMMRPGECVLDSSRGERVMRPGDCAAVPAGAASCTTS